MKRSRLSREGKRLKSQVPLAEQNCFNCFYTRQKKFPPLFKVQQKLQTASALWKFLRFQLRFQVKQTIMIIIFKFYSQLVPSWTRARNPNRALFCTRHCGDWPFKESKSQRVSLSRKVRFCLYKCLSRFVSNTRRAARHVEVTSLWIIFMRQSNNNRTNPAAQLNLFVIHV